MKKAVELLEDLFLIAAITAVASSFIAAVSYFIWYYYNR